MSTSFGLLDSSLKSSKVISKATPNITKARAIFKVHRDFASKLIGTLSITCSKNHGFGIANILLLFLTFILPKEVIDSNYI